MFQDFINDLDIDIMDGLLNTVYHDLEGKLMNQKINTETKLKENYRDLRLTRQTSKSKERTKKKSFKQSKPLSHNLIPVATSILKPISVSYKHIALNSLKKVHFSEFNITNNWRKQNLQLTEKKQFFEEAENSSKNSIIICDDIPSNFMFFDERRRSSNSKHHHDHHKQQKTAHKLNKQNQQGNQNNQSQSYFYIAQHEVRKRTQSHDYQQHKNSLLDY